LTPGSHPCETKTFTLRGRWVVQLSVNEPWTVDAPAISVPLAPWAGAVQVVVVELVTEGVGMGIRKSATTPARAKARKPVPTAMSPGRTLPGGGVRD
jgi:hypothetical protein